MTPRGRQTTKKASEREEEATAPYAVLSIGALSRATGVPVETLRTWERRYDFPKPAARGESGHRRYPIDAVERLRLVLRALEADHAPSVVLRLAPERLRELLSVSGTAAPAPRRLIDDRRGSFEDRCRRHVLELDGESLVAELERAWNDVGGLECVATRLGPFLTSLGEGWSEGAIEVGHEHFASEHIREFLIRHWRPLSERNASPSVVCATVGGELHVLGLHMAATVLALAGARVVFLGASTPPEDVARAAIRQHADAVALSAALGTPRRALAEDLRALRRALPEDYPILVGGEGFTETPDGVFALHDLHDLATWAKSFGG